MPNEPPVPTGSAARRASLASAATRLGNPPRSANALPLPRQPSASGVVTDEGVLRLRLNNTGTSNLQLVVDRRHPPVGPPLHYDLAPDQEHAAEVVTAAGTYEVAVHGPNGFLRVLGGDTASTLAGVEATLEVTGPASAPTLRLVLHNADGVTRAFRVSNRLGGSAAHRVPPRSTKDLLFQPLQHDRGWYDLTVDVEGVTSWGRRFAGHLERQGPSGPADR